MLHGQDISLPVFEQAAARLEPQQIRLAKLNTEEERAMAGQYGIMSIPTMVLFKGGKEIARQSGAMDINRLIDWIRSHLFDQCLTLNHVKISREKFSSLYKAHPPGVISAYMGLYILVTSFAMPGTALMTLLGGSLFGFWLGTLIVSFSSAIGATLACFISRYLLRDWVERKFGHRLSVIHEGLREKGKYYLFTLRMIPVFPFFAINLVMGLTPMPLTTFYWISQLGMLPGNMIYVNAGKELAQIESISEIFSPDLIISLALVGLFPLISRKLLHWYRSKAGRMKEKE
ncbi:MAG: VTT domain-containing protein [bacterium]